MKFFIYIVFILTIYGCSTSGNVNRKGKCPEIYENGYTEIINKKYYATSSNGTLVTNEIRFECVYSMFYTHKVMFDKFGKWDNQLFLERTHPVLIWRNVDLFANGKMYTVYTDGLEEWKHIYASIMVTDTTEKDLLAEDSLEKEKLISYFSDMIKTRNENSGFYEIYWKMVDPQNWERLKQYQN